MNKGKATIQLGFDHLIGWNGVGGITITGRITKFQFDIDKKNKPIYIKMSIQGAAGMQDITLWISSNGAGDAQVVDIRGNRIKFSGDIYSVQESSVYKGMDLF